MIKKYVGITLISSTVLLAACTSSDDGADTDTTSGADISELEDQMENDNPDGGSGDMPGGDMPNGDTTDGETPDEDMDETPNGDTESAGSSRDNEANPPVYSANSVMGIMSTQPDLKVFVNAVSTDPDYLDNTLNDANNEWTIFPPKDVAFDGVSVDRALLLGHVHQGRLRAGDLRGLVGSDIGMTNGERYDVTIADDGYTIQVGGVNLVQNDIFGDNGIIHKLDGVLMK